MRRVAQLPVTERSRIRPGRNQDPADSALHDWRDLVLQVLAAA